MSHNTYGVAGIDVTRDVVTAIYIIYMTCQHSYTSRIASRNVVWVIRRVQCNLVIRNWRLVVVVIQRFYVRLTTTTKDVINHHSCTFNLKQQTFWTCHTSLITTTIEVTYLTFL